jgi:hypothetical protein
MLTCTWPDAVPAAADPLLVVEAAAGPTQIGRDPAFAEPSDGLAIAAFHEFDRHACAGATAASCSAAADHDGAAVAEPAAGHRTVGGVQDRITGAFTG